MTRAVFAGLALFLILPVAHARDGAYEINQDCVAVGCFPGDDPGFPVQITKPGAYVLTSDLLVNAGAVPGISIAATPVDLDLNHHAIDGGGSCTGTPVTNCTPGQGNYGILHGYGAARGTFHLHDGTVHGFTNGIGGGPIAIILDEADGVVMERVYVTENGGNCAVAIGSDTKPGTLRVRDSQISRNLSYGMCPAAASGTPATFSAVVENDDFSGNGVYGILSFAALVVTGSRFTANGNLALNENAGAIVALGGNTFSGNNGGGANSQFTISTLRDMGGNVCIDHATCP